jgi:lysophospholipase L1-like esterase
VRGLRPAAAAFTAGVTLASCGAGDSEGPPRTGAGRTIVVAALGDSITAGTPGWDPDQQVRTGMLATPDVRSSYEYWAQRDLGPRVSFRNCGVNRQRTDEIAARLDACARGADVLIVQGGINDIAQGEDPVRAAANLLAMVRRGRALRLRVLIAELLPWNNGYPVAAPLIRRLNQEIRWIARAEGVRVLPFYRALEDPRRPGRMRPGLTIEGDHPSVAGYRRLGALVRMN